MQKELLPGNLLLRKVLLLKVCELKEKTPSLLGKVTLPRGKLECRSYHAKTSRNQIPDVDLGAVLPRRASGCAGCRRRENIFGLLGY